MITFFRISTPYKLEPTTTDRQTDRQTPYTLHQIMFMQDANSDPYLGTSTEMKKKTPVNLFPQRGKRGVPMKKACLPFVQQKYSLAQKKKKK